MTLQDNDQFLVSRGNTPYSVNSQTLVAKLQDLDLMLVCRSGVPFKATGAEIKSSLGSPGVNPGLNDITIDPSVPGSGTEADPYILQAQVVAPSGSTAQSVETITIIGQPPEAQVVWKDSSVDAGSRFAQVTGELTDASGAWTGQLEYADIPNSTEDATYVGKLSIGLVYFQWSIDQKVADAVAPTVDNVSLIESSPAGGARFTSESFVASSQVTDGLPIATKTFDAHVDGTLTKTVKFDEPLESSVVDTTGEWTQVLAPEANQWLSVAYGAGKFVAVAATGSAQVMYSTDGTSWTAAAASNFASWRSVTYADNKFVAVGYSNAMYSVDGINWTAAAGTGDDAWNSVTYGGGRFVAVALSGDNQVMHSVDGTSWISASAAEANSWSSVTYGNGKFVAVSDNSSRAMYSSDGITWTATSSAGDSTTWFAVTYGNGKFVAVAAYTGTDRVMYSTDGISWTSTSAAGDSNWAGVTYGDDKFVAVAADGTELVMYSADGINWTAAAAPQSSGWYGVTYGDNKFVAVSTEEAKTMWSSTGTGIDASLTFAAGTNMEALASGDAVNQTPQASGTVGSVNGTVVTLSSSSGTWTNGEDVVGPQKTITEANTRLYCAFDSSGNITDLQNNPQDPPYTTQGSNPGLTFTFPATFPSGQTPDQELPDGTTFTVEVTAENIAGTSGPISATVQPEPSEPDIQLAGLTTLYTGNSTTNTIVTGIDLLGNDGMIWIKNRSSTNDHQLEDTKRGAGYVMGTVNSPNSSQPDNNGIVQFENNGFSLGDAPSFNYDGDLYVAWTFAKAAGYFDVVEWSGDDVEGRLIPHGLDTAPGLIIVKCTTLNGNWMVWHKDLDFDNGESYLLLNTPSSAMGDTFPFSNPPTINDQVFSVNNYTTVNESGNDYIAYLFAADTPGVIKCGWGSGMGAIEPGFKPEWVLIKATDNARNWYILDKRLPQNKALSPNTPNVDIDFEYTLSDDSIKVLDNSYVGQDFIYVAIAAPPDTRSQTNEEFVETQAKFLTYNNRAEVKVGQEAEEKREEAIKQAEKLGIDTAEIKKLLGR